MRVAVLGLGAGGARVARQLASTDTVEEVVLRDLRPARVDEVAASLGDKATGERGPYHAPVEADVVVLAAPAGLHVELAGPLVARGIPVVSMSDADRGRPGPARLRSRSRGSGHPGRHRRRVRARADLRARRPGGRRLRVGGRDPRRPPRHRRSGVRSPAPPGATWLGDRLARRWLGPAPGRLGPRAVVVPGSGRSGGLLPSGPARRPAPGPGLPRHLPGHRPPGRQPTRPAHVTPPDAPPAAPGGWRRRRARRGPRAGRWIEPGRDLRGDRPAGCRRGRRGRPRGGRGGSWATSPILVRPASPASSTRPGSSSSWLGGA